jgi:hypothetical protein
MARQIFLISKWNFGRLSWRTSCISNGKFDLTVVPIDRHGAEIQFGERLSEPEAVFFTPEISIGMRESARCQFIQGLSTL